MRISALLGVLLVAGAALPAAAQSMKPGLWEINNKMSGSPQMDQAMAEMQKQLAGMPPDQRKQMEAMMAQSGVRMAPGAGGGMAAQICMTREMSERNDVPMQDGCTITQQQRSGSTTKVAFSCTKPPSSGEGTITLQGPEAYSSQMTVRTMVNGKSETVKMDSSGKWVATDCGSIKPFAVPKK
jgi:hypothetical protein